MVTVAFHCSKGRGGKLWLHGTPVWKICGTPRMVFYSVMEECALQMMITVLISASQVPVFLFQWKCQQSLAAAACKVCSPWGGWGKVGNVCGCSTHAGCWYEHSWCQAPWGNVMKVVCVALSCPLSSLSFFSRFCTMPVTGRLSIILNT